MKERAAVNFGVITRAFSSFSDGSMMVYISELNLGIVSSGHNNGSSAAESKKQPAGGAVNPWRFSVIGKSSLLLQHSLVVSKL